MENKREFVGPPEPNYEAYARELMGNKFRTGTNCGPASYSESGVRNSVAGMVEQRVMVNGYY